MTNWEYVFPENRLWQVMQIVSLDNLHEISMSIFWEK